jgi:hypothetical protein
MRTSATSRLGRDASNGFDCSSGVRLLGGRLGIDYLVAAAARVIAAATGGAALGAVNVSRFAHRGRRVDVAQARATGAGELLGHAGFPCVDARRSVERGDREDASVAENMPARHGFRGRFGPDAEAALPV